MLQTPDPETPVAVTEPEPEPVGVPAVTPPTKGDKIVGILTTWREERGFGFIETENKSHRYFVHANQMKLTPEVGMKVKFRIQADEHKTDRTEAVELELVEAAKRKEGCIARFQEQGGYGFVEDFQGNRHFFHSRNVHFLPYEGMAVSFELEKDKMKPDKFEAVRMESLEGGPPPPGPGGPWGPPPGPPGAFGGYGFGDRSRERDYGEWRAPPPFGFRGRGRGRGGFRGRGRGFGRGRGRGGPGGGYGYQPSAGNQYVPSQASYTPPQHQQYGTSGGFGAY